MNMYFDYHNSQILIYILVTKGGCWPGEPYKLHFFEIVGFTIASSVGQPLHLIPNWCYTTAHVGEVFEVSMQPRSLRELVSFWNFYQLWRDTFTCIIVSSPGKPLHLIPNWCYTTAHVGEVFEVSIQPRSLRELVSLWNFGGTLVRYFYLHYCFVTRQTVTFDTQLVLYNYPCGQSLWSLNTTEITPWVGIIMKLWRYFGVILLLALLFRRPANRYIWYPISVIQLLMWAKSLKFEYNRDHSVSWYHFETFTILWCDTFTCIIVSSPGKPLHLIPN